MRKLLFLISVLAFGVVSQAQEIEEPARVPFFAPKKWALCIGTQSYTNISPLKYSARDAMDFGSALQTELGFDKGSVRVLADAQGQTAPTSDNVNRTIDELLANRSLDRGDLFIVYFSGHGVGLDDGDYWLPNDTDPKNFKSRAIKIETVLSKLVAKKLRNVVVISDACRAGEQNTFGSRLISLGRKANIAVLLGCAPGAKSYESAKLGHGVFTNYLLKNLKSDAILDAETGALRMSALGKRVATAVEGFTKQDYGANAQKPLVAADQEQDVILATFPPKASGANEVLNAIGTQLKAKELSQDDARAALFLAGVHFEADNKPEPALKLYRQLYSLGENRPSFLLHFVTALLAQGRSAEANRVMGQLLDDPEPSTWIDLISVFGPKEAVSGPRLANAASSLFNSEYRDSVLDAIDLTFMERGMTYERGVQWSRMEKLTGTIWPAYAQLARRASLGSDVDLQEFLALKPSANQADIAARLVYSANLRARKFEACAALVSTRLNEDPGNGFWGMKRLVLATITRDPKRNEAIADQLKKCQGGRFALGCTFLLGPESKLFAAQFAEVAQRLPNSFEAQVAAWVSAAMIDLNTLAKIPESLRKLAPTEYEEYSVAILALSDALHRTGSSEKPDQSVVRAVNFSLAMSLEEDWRTHKVENADALVDVYRLLGRSDETWRVAHSYLNLEDKQIEAISDSRREEFYESVFVSMLNNGFIAPAEVVYGRLVELGKVDPYLELRYALARLHSGYRDGAVEMLASARKSALVGTELTLANLMDVHLAILAKDQKKVDALLDHLPKDSQFNDGLLLYSHYLALLNNSQSILTEETAKDFLAGSSEYHDVWSQITNLAITRIANDPKRLADTIVYNLMKAVGEDPLNSWFETTSYPGQTDFSGSYELSGVFATPSASAGGLLKCQIDTGGKVIGTIEVPSEKATLKLAGEVDGVGQFRGIITFEDGVSVNLTGRFLPVKILDALKSTEVPVLKFALDSSNPAGVMFVVTGLPRNNRL